MPGGACLQSCHLGGRYEDQNVEGSLGYIMSLRPAWTTRNSVSTKPNRKKKNFVQGLHHLGLRRHSIWENACYTSIRTCIWNFTTHGWKCVSIIPTTQGSRDEISLVSQPRWINEIQAQREILPQKQDRDWGTHSVCSGFYAHICRHSFTHICTHRYVYT